MTVGPASNECVITFIKQNDSIIIIIDYKVQTR